MNGVYGSFLLLIPHGFFLLLSFYIVLPWNIPLFKLWKDKLNKKFVVAENFAELVSTVCFNMPGGWGI